VRALEIDETLAEAHAALGLVTLLYDWDLAASERHFRRALELSPGYATGHHWYAELLMASGRPDEALAELRQAEELDPLSVILVADQGRALFFARRYEEAAARCRRALESDASFFPARIHLGMALEELGRVDEAMREYEEVVRLSDARQRVLVARALAAGGRKAEARRALEEVKALAARAYVSPYSISLVHAALDERDEAFAWLQRAADERTA
jgi:tetratricopeptide (TPR) repeat protein